MMHIFSRKKVLAWNKPETPSSTTTLPTSVLGLRGKW